MSRAQQQSDAVIVKPKMNVYTALVFVATVAVVLAVVVMHVRSQSLFGQGLFDM